MWIEGSDNAALFVCANAQGVSMQEQLTWADRDATLERLPARDGTLHWHWTGGDVLAVTDEMLSKYFGPKREWFAGQVIRFGPYHVQLMQRCETECGWLTRRM